MGGVQRFWEKRDGKLVLRLTWPCARRALALYVPRLSKLTVLLSAVRGIPRPAASRVAGGATVRHCEPPEGGNQWQPDAVLAQDAVLDDDDDTGGLAAGFSPSLAKGYSRGDPRGNVGTSLSAPPPPPPPPPSQAPPRGFYKPSAGESQASFQVAGRESTGSSTLVRHWTIAQAEEFQYTNSQLGPSSCAPASVLSALSMIKCLPENVGERVTLTDALIRLVRQRSCKCRHGSISAESACSVPLQQYLISRGECGGGGSVAMIDLIEQLCPSVVGAAVNIGDTYPFAGGQIVDWISDWMLDGAALTVTCNRQKTWDYLKSNPQKHSKRLGGMPDSWHAQPIIGVDLQKRQVLFANPVKAVPEEELEATLASPATLRVRGNEVLLHCQGVGSDKIQQYNWPNETWRQHGVSDQVLLLRKHFAGAAAPFPPGCTPFSRPHARFSGCCGRSTGHAQQVNMRAPAGELWTEANKAFLTIPYMGTGDNVGPVLRIFAPRDSAAGARILAQRDPSLYTMTV